MLDSRSLSRLSSTLAMSALMSGGAALAEDTPCPSTPAAETAPPAPTRPAVDSGKIEIEADEVTAGVNGDSTFKDNVRLRQGNREIRANDLEYRAADSAVKVNGELEYLDPLVRVTGRSGNYSASQGANFSAAEFELRGRSARGTARQMRLAPDGVIRLDRVKFTTCPRTDEAWQLRAKSITLDTESRVGTGRGTSVNFKGVPLLYLPWLSFPLGNERKSGFLFPSGGHSNRSGVQLAVPYYWNIAPQADFTFEPVYYGRRGVDVAGELRYLTATQQGRLSVNDLPNDSLANESRYRFELDHVAELPRGLRFTVDAETVSDAEYFEDFAQGSEGTSTPFLERLARLRYRDEHWLVDGEVQSFQTIIDDESDLPAVDRPYSRLPRLIANADFGWGPADRWRYGFESELVRFDRSIGVTGWRLDTTPAVSLEVGGAGYFLRPGVAWRFTQYELTDPLPGQRSSPSRSLPIASFDAGVVLERPSGARGQRRLTLEPRLLYLNIPFHDQDELPLFDTALPDLNPVQLFGTNRYVGADRVSDANQVSVGVTSRLYDTESGAQFLSATLGQIRYFTAPRVLLPGETRRSGPGSDFVAQLALTAYKDWNATLGLQWNPEGSRTERSHVGIQYRPAPNRVINIGYRFQREGFEPSLASEEGELEGLKQAEVSSAWPLAQRWNVFARYVHSFQDHTAIDRFAGFEYSSCCWRLRLLGRRFVSSRTGEQDTGIYLQLELTGLASVGSAADAFLTTAIRGYSRAEPVPQLKP